MLPRRQPARPVAAGSGLWVPPGVPAQIGSLTLPGGMLYIGKDLRSANGQGVEPALINPRLPVDHRRPDWQGSTVGYWPSYHGITAGARAAYLTWLSGGRQEPNAPISWVFLFFYGLERRALVEAAKPGPAREELPIISAEVSRLLELYGGNNSFRSYATSFLGLLDLYQADAEAGGAPERRPEKWRIPMRLRTGLGEFAATGLPVPAEWALAWAHYHPEIYPRTPATRCPAEFEALFLRRYAARHGAGLTIRATKSSLRYDYYPASAGIGQVQLSTNLPDVLTQAAPRAKLAALVEECTNSLDAYSRYLGRNPDGAGTLAATALLPPELVADAGGELARLAGFLEERLGGQPAVLIDAAELLAFWPTKTPGKVAKADAVAIAQLLATRGVGVEPDVRLGGPVLAAASPAVLFRTAAHQPTAASPEYAAAAVLLHLAAAVSIADGEVSDAETTHLARHLETAMHLSHPERVRLQAHLRWLLAGQVKLTGLTKRLALLDDAQREAIGDFLTTVAAADGHVSPSEITTLTRIFKLLGLDPASVYSRVHAATVGGPANIGATAPVTVRPATPGPSGYSIPPPPSTESESAAVAGESLAPQGVVRLDQAAVAAKLAETAAVSALLGSIFTDDEPTPEPAAKQAPAASIAGLDVAHSALLSALAGRGSWSRAEFEAECSILGLLPDGALDTLNEAAYDTVGDPVTAGEDPITIDLDVAQEMQA
ncbi:TerB N-terminal domain-containing protein [Jatrophihabitans sp.]|uniref:tellurite resistance TerB family protein n=1 Tax=Jatrophihabitans sp. TaxID=1932789 RepID=UPI002B9385F7|nr:TerB N-terminal domain-containing protein [Jatrophihabitans sp.]